MQEISQLNLYEMPTLDPAVSADPKPFIDRARDQHPWLAQSHVGLVVHDYKAIRDIMAMDDKLRMEYDGVVKLMGGEGTAWGRFTTESLTGADPETHRRLRSLMAPYFTPREATLHRPLMRDVITKQLDDWVPKGAFDFNEFASWFPVNVMVRLIGANPAVIPSLRWSMDQIGLAYTLDRSLLPKLQEAIRTLDDCMISLVAERRSAPRADGKPDLLDMMLEATVSGRMNDRELYDMLIFLFTAGYDTSKNILTLAMYQMIQNPDIYLRCAEDLDYCRKVTEETLRYHNSSMVWRSTNTDIIYRDVLIPAGTTLYFLANFAGRDPRYFVDADKFEPERPDSKRHTAFGLGAHICMGQFIARAQIQEGLHLIAQRIKNPRFAGELEWKSFIGLWGLKALPITFDAAPARENARMTEPV